MPLGKLNPKTVVSSKPEHKNGELSSFQFGCNNDSPNVHVPVKTQSKYGLNRQKYDQYMVCDRPTFKGIGTFRLGGGGGGGKF